MKPDALIRTKLHLPFTRSEQVSRPRLQEQIALGLRGPLTLVTAPAGFGKTTLVASCVAACGMPVAWLSLDKDDNQPERFLSYLVGALREADLKIGSEAAQLLAAARQAPPEAVLTSLINDLDATTRETALVLDDYQFISSQAVYEQISFLLEHCPKTFHVVIATRSDPSLPLARLRARGQMVELRAGDLSFTEPEAAQFLNEVMGLGLDAGSVSALEERTEGWIAGLQMASIALQAIAAQPHLSTRDRADVAGFIEGFSGTNRYILDYLLDEVLATQPPEIQHFLLYTSILNRLTAPLCDAVLAGGERPENGSAVILDYLERANLFLVPLDDARVWYRYHHLFADLLRTQLQKLLSADGVAQLNVRAADWHAANGSILEAIDHASAASDEGRVERLIEQHYREMVSRGEMFGYRFWTGKLSKELVYGRPWLCIYEAYSHAWFGELDEADRMIEAAENQIQSRSSAPDADAMLGHLAYVKSRVTAMRGEINRAIEFCLAASQGIPADNLALQFDARVTLGYEYFLAGDYGKATEILSETIRSGISAGAIINSVAAACVLARLYAVQGLLNKSLDTYEMAGELIPVASGGHRDARALVEIGIAGVFCERNDLQAALAHMRQGIALLPFWGKVDDSVLAYISLARIHLAQANTGEAAEAVERAGQLIETTGVFSEARNALEMARVRLWLAERDLRAVSRWASLQEERPASNEQFGFETELARISLARAHLALDKTGEAVRLLSRLERAARSAGRMGRVMEILVLQALAHQAHGDPEYATLVLGEVLAVAEPEGYARIFLDEGQPMQRLLDQWLIQHRAGPSRDYAVRLRGQFEAEPRTAAGPRGKRPPTAQLVEPLTQRELEVLGLMALGKTNPQIAEQLIIAPGTVKAHTASIYRKLDAANRLAAVARAHRLGLLP